ncbi:MAG TPA: hypothetical protein VG122_17255 [Gemmata sp.]|jgi:hypothetical protein|nr:hypothetical protein [Gemmata sp.]
MSRSRRRTAQVAAYWAAASYLAFTFAMVANVVAIHPELRDQEYGRRLGALRTRVAENSGRPLVVAIGSSRAAMDICPQAWEEVRHGTPSDPLLFNMSRVGAGPLLNLMTLRRLYADGIRPTAVLLEYWPPLLREAGPFREVDRIAPENLYACDRAFIRDYLPNAERVERRMLGVRLNPLFENRALWVREIVPSWLPRTQRIDGAVHPLDDWGWLPGMDRPALAWESRDSRLARCERIYRPHLAGLRIDPDADRAIHAAVALAREHGSAVGFVYLPESTEFRAWYTPESEQLGQAYAVALQSELGVPLLDARTWLPDESLADGFHATRAGAQEFTHRFGPAVADFVRIGHMAK